MVQATPTPPYGCALGYDRLASMLAHSDPRPVPHNIMEAKASKTVQVFFLWHHSKHNVDDAIKESHNNTKDSYESNHNLLQNHFNDRQWKSSPTYNRLISGFKRRYLLLEYLKLWTLELVIKLRMNYKYGKDWTWKLGKEYEERLIASPEWGFKISEKPILKVTSCLRILYLIFSDTFISKPSRSAFYC